MKEGKKEKEKVLQGKKGGLRALSSHSIYLSAIHLLTCNGGGRRGGKEEYMTAQQQSMSPQSFSKGIVVEGGTRKERGEKKHMLTAGWVGK